MICPVRVLWCALGCSMLGCVLECDMAGRHGVS